MAWFNLEAAEIRSQSLVKQHCTRVKIQCVGLAVSTEYSGIRLFPYKLRLERAARRFPLDRRLPGYDSIFK